MKYAIYILIGLAVCLLAYNVFHINWEAPFAEKSVVALIGIIACACAVILLLILLVSRKIAEKEKRSS